MVCLYCGGKTEVVNSRPQKRINQIWRRRKCSACGAVFTTNERIDYSATIVVKRKSGLEPFERDTLLVSLATSLGHRPTAVGDAAALATTVTRALLSAAENGVVEVTNITAESYKVLNRFDTLAAAHYRAYHTPSSA
jgi:transcriptional repressor NrdR